MLGGLLSKISTHSLVRLNELFNASEARLSVLLYVYKKANKKLRGVGNAFNDISGLQEWQGKVEKPECS